MSGFEIRPTLPSLLTVATDQHGEVADIAYKEGLLHNILYYNETLVYALHCGQFQSHNTF